MKIHSQYYQLEPDTIVSMIKESIIGPSDAK